MSQRITWRSRPRSKYPWPLATEELTDAEFAARLVELGIEDYVPSLIGPLPLKAVVELLYRVRAFKFDAEAEFEWLDGTKIVSRENDPIGPLVEDEKELWEKTYKAGKDGTPSPEYGTEDISFMGGGWAFMLADREAIATFWDYPVIATESGFYLNGFFQLGEVNDVEFYEFLWSTNDVGGTFLLFQADLVLASGTYPIDAIALSFSTSDILSAAMTITATEWYPYRTTAGEPAWDAATGKPINGGPMG